MPTTLPLDTPGSSQPCFSSTSRLLWIGPDAPFLASSIWRALRNSQGDDVFFDWFGSRLVAYSQRWVLRGQIFVHIAFLMALVLAFRRPEFNKRQFFLACLRCLAILILLVAAVAGVWWLISSVLAGRRIIGDCPANLFLLSALMLFGACVGTA